jgi:MscS family membrane protein
MRFALNDVEQAPLQPAAWPHWAVRTGPYGLTVWQWILIPVGSIAAFLAGSLFARLILRLLAPITRRVFPTVDARTLDRLRGPLTLFVSLGLGRLCLPWLALSVLGESTCLSALVAGLVFVTFWSMWRVIDVAVTHLSASARLYDNAGARSLLSIGAKVVKAVLVGLGAIMALQHLGVQVASLLAGLGIGGLAFALAAQKTIENLFGSVMIGVDRPFDIGDSIKIDDVVATVEQVGLRSTRLRTAEDTIVTIPNGRLADMRIENFSQRRRIRLAANLPIEHGTPVSVLASITRELRERLAGVEKVDPSTVVVALAAVSEGHSLIEVNLWFETPSFETFRSCRAQALILCIEVIEARGARLSSAQNPLRNGRAAG